MEFETILLETSPRSVAITLNRPQARNSLTQKSLSELAEAIRLAEASPHCQTIVLKGSPEFFCTGMDFTEAVTRFRRQNPDPGADEALNQLYMNLLAGIADSPCVVVALVDGMAMAGGIGLLAASDLVIASERARFTLSEALWGLLPAMVLPYLIRRVGFQTAYKMTLTSDTLTADAAAKAHLVDEIAENTAVRLRQLQTRLERLHKETISDVKRYFKGQLYPITIEQEKAAVREITRLSRSERIQSGIRNYVEDQIFPWESPR